MAQNWDTSAHIPLVKAGLMVKSIISVLGEETLSLGSCRGDFAKPQNMWCGHRKQKLPQALQEAETEWKWIIPEAASSDAGSSEQPRLVPRPGGGEPVQRWGNPFPVEGTPSTKSQE